MRDLEPRRPVDYLAVGHLAVDITPAGNQLGGSAAYAALTARALGLRAGIVTSAGGDAPLQMLEGIQIVLVPSEFSTTFENLETGQGRRQWLHHRAAPLSMEHVPPEWRDASIVHLAPIAQELEIDPMEPSSASWVGVTPQGWMRAWDVNGLVSACAWENSGQVLRHARAVVVSVDDVQRDLELVERMAHQTRLLCLTEGEAGAVLYWNGDRRRFRPPVVKEVDATGAGDVFAAAFFIRLHATRDPWEAARFATHLSAHSVTRPGLSGVPTQREVAECLMEVLS
jgi:sugar/nucleoside kinase (ribokinase family)